MDAADNIWNNACGLSPASALPGDVALNAALRIHGLVMSGGVLHAVESLDTGQLDAGESGYRWLGIEEVADLIRGVRDNVARGALDDEERADALEAESDERYSELLPSDAVLEAAFRVRLVSTPEAFS